MRSQGLNLPWLRVALLFVQPPRAKRNGSVRGSHEFPPGLAAGRVLPRSMTRMTGRSFGSCSSKHHPNEIQEQRSSSLTLATRA